jgi:mRNA interferase YafQ
MLELIFLNTFKKDLKKAEKRGKDMQKIAAVIKTIQEEKQLHPKHRNHKLKGEYNGLWECHIEPDWLFVYKIIDTTLICERTGTHSDLF